MPITVETLEKEVVIQILLKEKLLTYKGIKSYTTEGADPGEHLVNLNEQLGEKTIFVPLNSLADYEWRALDHPDTLKRYPKKQSLTGHVFEIGDLEKATEAIQEFFGKQEIELGQYGRPSLP